MKQPKTLKLEWRCPKAGDTRMEKILREVCAELKEKNVDIVLTKKKILGTKASEILFNDLPLEFLLDEARIKDNFCGTCSTAAERKRKSANLSKELIKKAAYKAAGFSH